MPMTEAEWLACTDPEPLLEFWGERASDRKLKFLACAFARTVWHRIKYDWSRKALEEVERYLEVLFDQHPKGIAGEYQRLHLQEAAVRAWEAQQEGVRQLNSRPYEQDSTAAQAVSWATLSLDPREAENEQYDERRRPMLSAENAAYYVHLTMRHAGEQEMANPPMAGLVRDVMGNPFRPVALNPAWLTPSVLALAQAAYDNRILPAGTLEPARLAVLADAVEEAGCDNADILNHLRQPGEHVRGCWVADLLLGKE
jgi:hypothetical protein